MAPRHVCKKVVRTNVLTVIRKSPNEYREICANVQTFFGNFPRDSKVRRVATAKLTSMIENRSFNLTQAHKAQLKSGSIWFLPARTLLNIRGSLLASRS